MLLKLNFSYTNDIEMEHSSCACVDLYKIMSQNFALVCFRWKWYCFWMSDVTQILPPFHYIRCFSFVKQVYLDIF
jgi:hypothetical protein